MKQTQNNGTTENNWYQDWRYERDPARGETVETEHLIVTQAYNAHIQIIAKKSGRLIAFVSCTAMFPKKALQAFADGLEKKDGVFSEEVLQAL